MRPRFERALDPVVTVPVDATARAIADRMRSEEVGSVVVLDGESPVGIVTDRDLLVRVVAKRRDAGTLSARDVMSAPLLAAPVDEPLEKVVDRMASHGIRRIPLLSGQRLVGIVSLDDLLVHLAGEVGGIALGVRRQDQAARRRRRRSAFVRRAGDAAERGLEGVLGLRRRLEPLRAWLRGERATSASEQKRNP